MTNNTCAAHFRLFDLPQEIQDKIYSHYFEIAEIRYDIQKRQFLNLPCLAIERSCRKLWHDCHPIRQRIWPRRLILCHKRSSIYESVSTPAGADQKLSLSHKKGAHEHFEVFVFENLRIRSSWDWIALLEKFS